MGRMWALILFVPWLTGCGAVALPCKLARDVVEVVPIAGKPMAQPFNACANAID